MRRQLLGEEGGEINDTNKLPHMVVCFAHLYIVWFLRALKNKAQVQNQAQLVAQ